MSVAVEFSTIDEMFDKLTTTFAGEQRPVLMSKSSGVYRGLSYASLRREVDDFTCGLSLLGVRRGDHCALISENRTEWVVADMSMLRLGAVSVPLYTTLSPKQIGFILNDAGVKFAIVSNLLQLNKVRAVLTDIPSLEKIVVMNGGERLADARTVTYAGVLQKGISADARQRDAAAAESRKIRPSDLLTIIYTSGTTGNPKGVMLTHENLVSNIHAAADSIPISTKSVLLTFLPFCHSFERMAGYYTAMSCGATIAFAESIETVADNLKEIRPTFVTAVPRFYERIRNKVDRALEASTPLERRIFNWAVSVGRTYAAGRRAGTISLMTRMKFLAADRLALRKVRMRFGGRIEYLVSGGAALPPEIGGFFDACGMVVLEGYGLTESSPVISVNRVDNFKVGTVGHPIPGVKVKIAQDGEILVNGPCVMKGYWKRPAETAEAVDAEGWLHTGDVGKFDDEGFLVITDRKKHLFVSSGGKNIAPQPIENLLLQSEYIDQVVLIGDKRMFCTALVIPQFDAVRFFARRQNIAFGDDAALAGSPEVFQLLQEEINMLQKDLAPFERVRKFAVLSRSLTIEGGEITPTLKVRRKVVEERFKEEIEAMYKGIG